MGTVRGHWDQRESICVLGEQNSYGDDGKAMQKGICEKRHQIIHLKSGMACGSGMKHTKQVQGDRFVSSLWFVIEPVTTTRPLRLCLQIARLTWLASITDITSKSTYSTKYYILQLGFGW